MITQVHSNWEFKGIIVKSSSLHMVSPWELKWHCIGAAKQAVNIMKPMKIIIVPFLIMESISLVALLSLCPFLHLHIYALVRSRVHSERSGLPLPKVSLWVGGRLFRLFWGVVKEKAVAWQHSSFFSSDCLSPLYWAWPWKTIEILTHPGMTNRGGEKCQKQKVRKQRRENWDWSDTNDLFQVCHCM